MTPQKFFDLDEMEQAETIWKGMHIADREDIEHNIRLYKMEDLYVEAFYHKDYKVLRRFEALRNMNSYRTYTLRGKIISF